MTTTPASRPSFVALAALILGAATLATCSADFQSGVTKCSPARECPEGFTCAADGTCHDDSPGGINPAVATGGTSGTTNPGGIAPGAGGTSGGITPGAGGTSGAGTPDAGTNPMAGGPPGTAAELLGRWVRGTPTQGEGWDFSSGSKFALVVFSIANGSSKVEVSLQGHYTVSGGKVTIGTEQSSCPGTAANTLSIPYQVMANDLSMTIGTQTIKYTKGAAPELPDPTFGCFDKSGNFTPGMIQTAGQTPGGMTPGGMGGMTPGAGAVIKFCNATPVSADLTIGSQTYTAASMACTPMKGMACNALPAGATTFNVKVGGSPIAPQTVAVKDGDQVVVAVYFMKGVTEPQLLVAGLKPTDPPCAMYEPF